MTRHQRLLPLFLMGIVAWAAPSRAAKFEATKIFIEYNSTDNDLGFHVFLDAEEWNSVKIVNPAGITIFDVAGRGPYHDLGLSELFFEGAEPTLDQFPLNDLLARFPEGKYKFLGETPGGTGLQSTATLTHAVPAGPSISSEVNGDTVIIRWTPVTGPPAGFPQETINIAGYQIIVDAFQVTLPASSTQVTLPREFVHSLKAGAHGFEVLAIEAGGNQTITAASFATQ